MRPTPFVALAFLLSGCAAGPTVGEAPADAEVVAEMRYTSAPQEADAWLDAASLPSDAVRTDAERALLLEVSLPADGSVLTEIAPLELANLVVRIEEHDRRQIVVGIDNASEAALAFDLFVSPDGERFRRIESCPVAARGRGFVRWPQAAGWIALAGVRRAEGGDCR